MTVTVPAEELPAASGQRVIVCVLYVVVMFLTLLDSTVVNVSIPAIATDLGITTDSIEWVVTAYLLGLACTVPLSGWFAGRFGTKRMFMVTVAGFVASSAVCGAAHNLGMLVAARFAQGLAGGMLLPLGLAMLFQVFPPVERARVAKILLIPTSVAPAVGPVLGGWITEDLGWQWVFLLNLPIGFAAIAAGGVWLAADHPHAPSSRLDWQSALLVSGGLAALLYALGEGARGGWSATVLAVSALGMIALGVFVRRTLGLAAPVLDIRVLSDRLFRSTVLVMCCSSGAFVGTLFIVPLFVQKVRHMTPLESGLTTFPEALGVIAASQIVGRLYPVVGPRRLLTGAMLGLTASVGALALLLDDGSVWALRVVMFASGVAFGFVLVSLRAASFARIEPPRMPQASSLFQTINQVSAATGVAVLAAALTIAASQSDPVQGYRVALWVATVVTLVGAAAALRIRDSDAAASMAQRRTG